MPPPWSTYNSRSRAWQLPSEARFRAGEGESAGLRQRHQEIRQLVEGGFDRLESAIVREGDADTRCADRAAHRAGCRLARRQAPLCSNRSCERRDLWFGSSRSFAMLAPSISCSKDDRLSGLVDFGAMGVESVAGDLARSWRRWLDGDSAGSASKPLATYERVRPLDCTESGLIAVFEAGTALLIGERWVRWHYCENRSFDDPQAVVEQDSSADSSSSSAYVQWDRLAGDTGSHTSRFSSKRIGEQALGIFLVEVDAADRHARPVSGSTVTTAPLSRGSPVATSKWAGTQDNVADKTRS